MKDINVSAVQKNIKLILQKVPLPTNDFLSSDELAGVVAGNIDDLVRTKLDNIRVWFNPKGWTSSVGYLNAVNNLVLRASIQTQVEAFEYEGEFKDPAEYGISVISHPMNFTEEQLSEKNIRLVGISLLHAICIIFAMSFVPASFVVHLIDERVSKVKHLHFVSSVMPLTYWIAAFVWDIGMYLITSIIVSIITFCKQTFVNKLLLTFVVCHHLHHLRRRSLCL